MKVIITLKSLKYVFSHFDRKMIVRGFLNKKSEDWKSHNCHSQLSLSILWFHVQKTSCEHLTIKIIKDVT